MISPNSSTRFVATLSGKGGTGKSIITVSMGYILAHCGFRTLLVDVDLFTGGMSFYSLAGNPRNSPFGLRDWLLGRNEMGNSSPSPVAIPQVFCSNNLFLLPALPTKARHRSELALNSELRNVSTFVASLREIISVVNKEKAFDYVLMDTRGGTDVTSVSTALVADGFIIVTEADKTSWDVGEILLTALNEAADGELTARALGFIINKNVLPPDSIVAFLRQRWDCPHLVTIPLDENAIRFYQEDKVPVAEDANCPFSASLIPIIRKLFVDETWDRKSTLALESLETRSRKAQELRIATERSFFRAERLSLLVKLYGTILSTSLLLWLVVSARKDSTSFAQEMIAIIAAVLIFVMTGSDPKVLESLLGRKPQPRAKNETDEEVKR